MKRTTILAILFAIVIAVGCKKENTTPQPPAITFVDAQFSADKSASIVSFEFFDANGDLGLQQEENKGEQQFNIFVDYYEKEDGVWALKSPIIAAIPDADEPTGFRFDTTVTHLRFPFLENEDGSSLTGTARIELFYNNFIQPLADTFRYEIYINDRAFQKSNIITTTEMIVPN